MNRKPLQFLILFLLSALFIFSSGIATADNDENIIEVVKIGTDITVTENQVLTDAVAIGGSVTILENGRVTGDVTSMGGDVILKPNAQVGGNAVALAGNIIKADSAIVNGDEVEILSGATAIVERLGVFGTLYLGSVIFNVTWMLVIIAFGIFLLLLLPGHLHTIAETMSQHPFKSAIWGLGAIIAVTLITALIAGSILGILIIPIINVALAVTALLGCVTTGLWVGQRTPLADQGNGIKPFLFGMVILGIISVIPIAGGLIVLMVTLFGFGAVLLSRVGTVLPDSIGKGLDHLEGTTSSSET